MGYPYGLRKPPMERGTSLYKPADELPALLRFSAVEAVNQLVDQLVALGSFTSLNSTRVNQSAEAPMIHSAEHVDRSLVSGQVELISSVKLLEMPDGSKEELGTSSHGGKGWWLMC